MSITPEGSSKSYFQGQSRSDAREDSVPASYTGESTFFGSLFDFSFEESITPMIVRGSFKLYLVIDVLLSFAIFAAFSSRAPLIGIAAGAIFFFVSLILVRFSMEAAMTLHNIEKYARAIARKKSE